MREIGFAVLFQFFNDLLVLQRAEDRFRIDSRQLVVIDAGKLTVDPVGNGAVGRNVDVGSFSFLRLGKDLVDRIELFRDIRLFLSVVIQSRTSRSNGMKSVIFLRQLYLHLFLMFRFLQYQFSNETLSISVMEVVPSSTSSVAAIRRVFMPSFSAVSRIWSVVPCAEMISFRSCVIGMIS